MLSRKKRILFSVVPTLLLLALLGLTEIALRQLATSLSSPFTREIMLAGVEWHEVNRGYLERYFPAGSPMVPELKPSLIRKLKRPGAARIFCVGESSMYGTPYEMSATIPALVRKQLRHILPGREIEVINFGASAVNSNVFVDMAPELVRLQPDVVLLYAGHNEFYGPDGVGASWLESRFPFLTGLKYRVRDWRVVRLAQRLFSGAVSVPREDQRNLMKQVSQGATVDLRSGDAQRVFTNFERNLTGLFRTFRAAGIPVVASDVTSNLQFPPFASPARDSLADIPRLFGAGQYRDVVLRLAPLASTDSSNAFVHYWLGMSLQALGHPAAISHLRRARDEDLLKFRAPDRINGIIRDVAEREAVPFTSADSLFARAGSTAALPLFTEHLHPTFRGYDLIARLFVNALLGARLVSVPDGEAALLPFDRDSLNICWLDLAYADLSLRNLTGRWPFSNFGYIPVTWASADSLRRQIAVDVYNRKIGWTDGCYRSAEAAGAAGDAYEAIRTYGALADENPFDFYARYRLATALKAIGNLPRATEEYTRAIAINPDYPFARLELGLLENNAGDFDAAAVQLTRALQLTEGKGNEAIRAQILYGLSAAFANKDDVAKAVRYAEESLRLAPHYKPARDLLEKLVRAKDSRK
jgi:tetratricopeptide (TPR) repeat protein